jgi:hypothetical protein
VTVTLRQPDADEYAAWKATRLLLSELLNVFGQNAIAQALYSGLGCRETSVQMRKEL